MALRPHETAAIVFDGFEWPPGLPHEDAARIEQRVRDEIMLYPVVSFPSYWRGRLRYLAERALLASTWRPVRPASSERN